MIDLLLPHAQVAWAQSMTPNTFVLRLPGLAAIVRPDHSWEVFRSQGEMITLARGHTNKREASQKEATTALYNLLVQYTDALSALKESL